MPQIIADGSYVLPVCPLCGEENGDVQYEYPDIKIIRCVRCGLWRTCPRLSERDLNAYYEQHHYSEKHEQAGKYEQWRVRNKGVWAHNARLVKMEAERRGLLHDGKVRVLDVGSGHGFFQDECNALGMVSRGIETSPHAVRYAREQLKVDVRQLELEALPPDEFYEVITLWGVLEHLPDPLKAMKQVYQHLVPGGMTWVMTPNTNALERVIRGANYFNFLNKSHLTHFHRRTLKRLLEEAGFENVTRYVHYGGGARSGPAAMAQYVARVLCLGTELRFTGIRRR
jgi:2-polyprenyl-3-methyl-5-hydroxy-6-metoxy-1,4-benzoquinol methylase